MESLSSNNNNHQADIASTLDNLISNVTYLFVASFLIVSISIALIL